LQRVAREIIRAARDGIIRSKADLQRLKRRLCRQYHLPRFPRDTEILAYATEEEKRHISLLLRKKPTRTLSGVAIIAVMTRPMECPGQCIYCPTNLSIAPKAYVGEEPAALRARQNQYDPYRQVRSRLQQLRDMGHSTDKVELIVMGGTFLAAPESYQRHFMKRCLDAMTGREASSLEEALKWAEVSPVRPVGITIETRPDYCRPSHVDAMLALGATRVELGVQTIYDDIYRLVRRGHMVADVISATRVARDAGLKICYHIMPGLPGSNPERDLQMFRDLFQREEFRPDMLKIYPCLVLRGSVLFDLWRKGEYTPYTTEQVVELLSEAISLIPPWVRIQRMQRDIPARLIVAGPTAGNLTQLVFRRAQEKGYPIRTIRYREPGYKIRVAQSARPASIPDPESLELRIEEYAASGGTELFLSLEDSENDSLVGFLRLRFPSSTAHRPEIRDHNAALIRELHVFGPLVSLGHREEEAWQHRGLGTRLLLEAEEQAKRRGYSNIVCISGVGARRYYLRRGYHRDGPYVSKKLQGR